MTDQRPCVALLCLRLRRFYFGAFGGPTLRDSETVSPWLIIVVSVLGFSTVIVTLSVDITNGVRRWCCNKGNKEGEGERPPETVMTHLQELSADMAAVRDLQQRQSSLMEKIGVRA